LLRGCFWGVVEVPARGCEVGRESREECDVNSDVNSESDSVVEEEPELAVTFACVCAGAARLKAGRLAIAVCEVAPLSGVAG
jgi:hypothetical protein